MKQHLFLLILSIIVVVTTSFEYHTRSVQQVCATNYASVNSYEGNFVKGHADGDLIRFMMEQKNGIEPSVWLQYFAFASNWNTAAQLKIKIETNTYDAEVEEKKAGGGMVNLFFGVIFQSLIQYTDKNHNGKFDPKEDTIVKQVFLYNETYKPMTCAPKAPADGLYDYSIETTNDLFKLDFTVSTKVVNQKGKPALNPNSTKISISVNDFPYDTSSGGNSLLALQAFFISSKVRKNIGASRESDAYVNFGSKAYQGYFSWEGKAVVDDKHEVKVSQTSLSTYDGNNIKYGMKADQTASELYWSINAKQPNKVFWDPSIGFGHVPEHGSAAGLLVWLFDKVGIWMIIMLVCAVFMGAFVTAVVLGGVIAYKKKYPAGVKYEKL